MILAYRWTPTKQAFRADGEVYFHRGGTDTSPSHDLAHLVLAAGSQLPWLPRGQDLKLAEFNAVTLEHICDRIVRRPGIDALNDALKHSQDFVTRHYAPFPIPFPEALNRFRRGLDVESVLRLSPYLLQQRMFECLTPEHRNREHVGRFQSGARPHVPDHLVYHVASLAKSLARLLRG